MALNNRPPMPKSPKVSNTQLRKYYKSQHKQCEVCVLEGAETPVEDIHHIVPGAGRTDKLWNLIALCRNHHDQCTEHIHGFTAVQKNIMLFGIKYLKGEISTEKLKELDLHTETMVAIRVIEPEFKKYKEGKI